MKSPATSGKWTYEDYLLFPQDGKRHELLHGERFLTPAPGTRHQRISMRLSRILSSHLQAHPRGELFAAPCDVVLSDVDVVQPDLLFVAAERAGIVTGKNIQGAPDLIIEIASEGTRRTDRTVKRKLYQEHGVAEYWIVDPEAETVEIYRLERGRYGPALELTLQADASAVSALLPGFAIPLRQIFR